jgi:Protein required for attachment to host cells
MFSARCAISPNELVEEVKHRLPPMMRAVLSHPSARVKVLNSPSQAAIVVRWCGLILLRAAAGSSELPGIVVVAPAGTLAELRQCVSTNIKGRIFAEVRKDLTKHPVTEIEAHLLHSHAA